MALAAASASAAAFLYDAFPGGEIRGQLFARVPEPASWALMIAGFGLLGGAVRTRPRLLARA